MRNLLFAFLFINSAFALDGRHIQEASFNALEQASYELDEGTLFAFETRLHGEEYLSAKFITTEDKRLAYACDMHTEGLVCHEELFETGERSYPAANPVSLELLKQAHQNAIKALDDELRRHRRSIAMAKRAKTWSVKTTKGNVIWNRIVFDFTFGGQNKVAYFSCPLSKENVLGACAYSRTTELQPAFDFGDNGHGHDHHH